MPAAENGSGEAVRRLPRKTAAEKLKDGSRVYTGETGV